MFDREELTRNFSNNSISLMYEAIRHAMKTSPLVVQEDVVSWKKWATELERIMESKGITYRRIDFSF